MKKYEFLPWFFVLGLTLYAPPPPAPGGPTVDPTLIPQPTAPSSIGGPVTVQPLTIGSPGVTSTARVITTGMPLVTQQPPATEPKPCVLGACVIPAPLPSPAPGLQ